MIENEGEPEPMIGARAAGRLLGVHENTVRLWARKGWLTPIPLYAGHPHHRYRVEEVLTLAQANEAWKRHTRRGSA